MCPKRNTESFIKEAKEIHGDKYDYSKVEYINNRAKVCIICPKHGEFLQNPVKHLIGQGCPFCSNTMHGSTTSFIKNAKEIHGEDYDYSKVEYINNKTKVCIICPEHGEFWQDPHNHLKGEGCPICSKRKTRHKKHTTESFVEEAQKIHGEHYKYDNTEYVNMNQKVRIICPIHGEFWQTPYAHLYGYGCKKCSTDKNGFNKRKSTEEFIEQAKLAHGDKYDYSESVYYTAKNKIKIICPTHGAFYQSPWKHITGCGCPKCVHHVSKNENEIYEFIKKSLPENKIIQSERKIINPKEIDIYIPELKIGIEYNGLYWHSDINKDSHIEKLKLAQAKGIKLIQIFEDEYINNKELVLKKISHIIGVDGAKSKIPGRKCEIKEISDVEAKLFLEKNNIQGYSRSTVYLGSFYNGKLIAVMSFKRKENESNDFELTRFASDNDYICQGVGEKLFSYFVKKYNPYKIKSFADRRWTTDEKNNIYIKLGFDFDGYTPPDYKYFNPNDGIKRQHKFGFRKQKLNKKYGLPLSMTESEMTEKLGYMRIYDCGLIRYVWHSNKNHNQDVKKENV